MNASVLLNGSEDFQTAVLRAFRGEQCYAETPVSLLRMHAAMVEDGSGAGLDCVVGKQWWKAAWCHGGRRQSCRAALRVGETSICNRRLVVRSLTCRRQRLRRAQQEGKRTRSEQGQKLLSGSTGKPVVDNAVWEKLARQFYTLHSALRQKR